MQTIGFTPLTFAYPKGERTREFDEANLERFDFIRATAYRRGQAPIRDWDEVFYKGPTDRKVVYGVGIDHRYEHSVEEIRGGLERARQEGEVNSLRSQVVE